MNYKRSRFLYSLILAGFNSTIATAQHVDGPYVFYNHDTVAVRSIVQKDGKPTMEEKTFIKDQNKIHITVPPFDSITTGFELDLRPALEVGPSTFDKPQKLFVLSDIEGEFAAFRSLLLGNGVMDQNYAWTFGNGHLVICGDLFDRGPRVTEYLWLLYKLEDDAKAKGGYVHVILGNHDIMNLSGDFRYVQPKYFESATAMGLQYKDLIAENTELGKWLRTKNIIEKIGDILYMHAGISSEVNRAGLSVQALNDSSRPYYSTPIDSIPDAVYRYFGGNSSPFWYRGYFMDPKATSSQVDSTLQLFNVNKVVAGHTIIDDITRLYDGKVIGLDVNQHAGNHQALLIEGDEMYRVDNKGERKKLAKRL